MRLTKYLGLTNRLGQLQLIILLLTLVGCEAKFEGKAEADNGSLTEESTAQSDTSPVSPPASNVLTEFVKMFESAYTPTVEDYQTYFGFADIQEIALIWQGCEKSRLPDGREQGVLKNESCYRRVTDHWYDKTTKTSEYFAWLRKKLPLNPELKVEQMTTIPGEGQRWKVKFNKSQVELWEPESPQDNTGKLWLLSIDEVPISFLLEKEVEQSLIIALGKTQLVRPWTQKEMKVLKAHREKQCQLEPTCVKAQQAIEKERAAAIKEQQRKRAKFTAWCKRQDGAVCDDYEAHDKTWIATVNRLKENCENNYEECVGELTALFTRTKGLRAKYCQDEPVECRGEKEFHTKTVKRLKAQIAQCAATPGDAAHCDTDGDRFFEAVTQAKIAAY